MKKIATESSWNCRYKNYWRAKIHFRGPYIHLKILSPFIIVLRKKQPYLEMPFEPRHEKTGYYLYAKQRRSTADQRLCFHHADSTISKFTQNIKLVAFSVTVQAGYCNSRRPAAFGDASVMIFKT